MKSSVGKNNFKILAWLFLGAVIGFGTSGFFASSIFADGSYEETPAQKPISLESTESSSNDSAEKELMEAKEASDSVSSLEEMKPKETGSSGKKGSAQRVRSAEAFVVG